MLSLRALPLTALLVIAAASVTLAVHVDLSPLTTNIILDEVVAAEPGSAVHTPSKEMLVIEKDMERLDVINNAKPAGQVSDVAITLVEPAAIEKVTPIHSQGIGEAYSISRSKEEAKNDPLNKPKDTFSWPNDPLGGLPKSEEEKALDNFFNSLEHSLEEALDQIPDSMEEKALEEILAMSEEDNHLMESTFLPKMGPVDVFMKTVYDALHGHHHHREEEDNDDETEESTEEGMLLPPDFPRPPRGPDSGSPHHRPHFPHPPPGRHPHYPGHPGHRLPPWHPPVHRCPHHGDHKHGHDHHKNTPILSFMD